ncbi:hypothetical protein MMC24_002180 [Lignoscripta atroalba]|nr:hypothetical protein [Lignoscripta atroalba]
MAEPISLIGLAVSCAQIVSALRDAIETVKDGPQALRDLLDRVTTLNLLLDRLQLKELQLTADRRQFLHSYFNTRKCQDTVSLLDKLVQNLRPKKTGTLEDMKTGVKYLLKKSDAEALMVKLDEQQRDITTAMVMVSGEAIVDIEKILGDAIARVQPVIAFQETPPTITRPKSSTSYFERRHTWLGQLCSKENDHSESRLSYLKDRDALANASYCGDWWRVFNLIDQAMVHYKEIWVNCIRMTRSPEQIPSGYTALHQAAYHGASVELVQKLLDLGAWRTARTIEDPDKTPLDVARKHGWQHLYGILAPVIRHTLPPNTLAALQNHFHHLVHSKDQGSVIGPGVRLPDLSLLTEFEEAELWFPIPNQSGTGYLIMLDGRELLVKSIHPTMKHRIFRISEKGTKEIEEAVLIHR